MPRYLNSPRLRKPKRFPTAREQRVRALCKLAVVVVFSPLLLLIMILLSPALLWQWRRSRLKEKQQQAEEALRPKPTPPPVDPELERRRELAMRTNKQNHPRIRHLYDPISDDPAYAWAIKEAGERAKEEVGHPFVMGTCHRVWNRKKEILKEEFGIDWYSPREMNPRVIFD
jgi:hypothetical protein